jgi:hypothetical protein
VLVVMYYADQGSESEEKLRILGSLAKEPVIPQPDESHAG